MRAGADDEARRRSGPCHPHDRARYELFWMALVLTDPFARQIEHTFAEASLRRIRPGFDAVPSGADMPRHRHFDAYAIVVVAGRFEQVNYAGRLIARTGDILVQPTLDCHANYMVSAGAEILRLHWPFESGAGGVHALRDADAIIRIAERDPHAASLEAFGEVSECGLRRGELRDWPDLLAADLAGGQLNGLIDWAHSHGLARETVSRGFTKAYEVSPAAFRLEVRARRAWVLAVTTRDRLADIAAETGFADQAHMTRSIKSLTGASPKAWRRKLHAELKDADALALKTPRAIT